MWLFCQNWIFMLEKGRSVDYFALESANHCDCDYCNNFYSTVDASYPGLRPLLSEFGVDIEAPDMMIPLEIPTECVIYYSVAGRIMQTNKKVISMDGVSIIPQTEPLKAICSSVDMPCFYLRVEGVRLPWSLRQHIEDVASPANAPLFANCAKEALLSGSQK